MLVSVSTTQGPTNEALETLLSSPVLTATVAVTSLALIPKVVKVRTHAVQCPPQHSLYEHSGGTCGVKSEGWDV